MTGRTITFASALSLLLCIVLTVEAIRGVYRIDQLTLQTPVGTFEFTSCWGTIDLEITRSTDIGRRTPWYSQEVRYLVRARMVIWGWYRPYWVISSETRFLGIGYMTGWTTDVSLRTSDGTYPPVRARMLSLPCWMPPLIAAFLPAWWFPRRRRSRQRVRRIGRGECAECGYSLAGNPSGVCPECGTPIKAMVIA